MNFLKQKSVILLFLIIFLGGMVRVVNLSTNPPGLSWDEAALGYNAYSLLTTGRDEYGVFLPHTLQSFNDYKPAFYAYLAIPFIALLGLTEVAVRLPSALLGTASIGLIYLLTQQLFKQRRLSIITALFFALSPLSIQFSRGAWEVNVALFLNLLGAILLIKGFEHARYFIPAAVVFGLSLFTYQSSRLFVPLLVLFLFALHRSRVRITQSLSLAGFIGGIFVVILLFSLFFAGGAHRLTELNFLAYPRQPEIVDRLVAESGFMKDSWQFNLLHGEWWHSVTGFVERFLTYLSPDVLFIKGDYSERHRVPDLGMLYYLSALLIPLGIWRLFKDHPKQVAFVVGWLVIAILPAALSRDLISSVRALNMVVPIVILEGLGLYWILYQQRVWYRHLLSVIVVSLLVFNIAIYFDRLYVHLPKEYQNAWSGGYKEVFTALNLSKSYDHIYITDSYGQPYIYYLFYTKFPPQEYQLSRKFGNLEFGWIDWQKYQYDSRTLIVANPKELTGFNPDMSKYKVTDEIKTSTGEVLFKILESP